MDSDPRKELILLKHRLLGKILEKPADLLTDSEVDIGYALAKDPDIQKTMKTMREMGGD